jgi:hypothetical protein
MYGTNAYVIRLATDDDGDAVTRLAALDSARPLEGRVLVGEIDGEPAAALSLSEGRVVADPFRRTDLLVVHLRLRAQGILAHERQPSLSERVRAALQPRPAAAPDPA